MATARTALERKARLRVFLAEWRIATSRAPSLRRLELFLTAAHPLLAAAPRPRPTSPPDAASLRTLFPDLRAAIGRARSSGRLINPWTAAGLGRREVRNAASLASLWSATRTGDAGLRFLSGFLDLVPGADGALPKLEELSHGYSVRTERRFGADGADRVDVVLESVGHLVGIEVKIDAVEGRDQLGRYVHAVGREARQIGKVPAVVLLAPFAPSLVEVLPADWSMVRIAAEAVLPARRCDATFAERLVGEFGAHVAGFRRVRS